MQHLKDQSPNQVEDSEIVVTQQASATGSPNALSPKILKNDQ